MLNWTRSRSRENKFPPHFFQFLWKYYDHLHGLTQMSECSIWAFYFWAYFEAQKGQKFWRARRIGYAMQSSSTPPNAFDSEWSEIAYINAALGKP